MPKVIAVHSDGDVSGVTHFEDGSKLWWTEAYTPCVLEKADGTSETIEDLDGHPFTKELNSGTCEGQFSCKEGETTPEENMKLNELFGVGGEEE